MYDAHVLVPVDSTIIRSADQDAENEDTENTDVKNDGSEKAYGSQSGADKRTDAQNSKTRLHIPPVILKTSLCVIFLTALTAIFSVSLKAAPVFVFFPLTPI